MWTSAVDQTGTAAFYLGLGLVLSHLTGEGSAVVQVWCRPGQRITLTCSYHYEDQAQVSQLSVQWRSPHNQLLCHYIKHKSFQNCSAGYDISYQPGSILLTIQQVRAPDLGTHMCSVSKRHEFHDYRIQLDRMTEAVTSAPMSGVRRSGLTWSLTWNLTILPALTSLFVHL